MFDTVIKKKNTQAAKVITPYTVRIVVLMVPVSPIRFLHMDSEDIARAPL
jgi:hypothetical protein